MSAGVKIVAYLTPEAGARPSIVELKMFCGRVLPASMNPDVFVFLDALPRTSTNKVDYQELARVHAQGSRAACGATFEALLERDDRCRSRRCSAWSDAARDDLPASDEGELSRGAGDAARPGTCLRRRCSTRSRTVVRLAAESCRRQRPTTRTPRAISAAVRATAEGARQRSRRSCGSSPVDLSRVRARRGRSARRDRERLEPRA